MSPDRLRSVLSLLEKEALVDLAVRLQGQIDALRVANAAALMRYAKEDALRSGRSQ